MVQLVDFQFFSRRRTSLALLLIFAFQQEALPMSLFNPTKTCVFSAVKAKLTRNGVPLKGVTVIRRWKWHEPREDAAKTDDKGQFTFPAVFESSVTRLLPMEVVIGQSMYVKVNGEEEMFWVNSKRDGKENGEYGGRVMSLVCEMTNEMKIYNDGGVMMSTLCSLEP
jgi:hypothetical protein